MIHFCNSLIFLFEAIQIMRETLESVAQCHQMSHKFKWRFGLIKCHVTHFLLNLLQSYF
jgi:hypothetical protein